MRLVFMTLFVTFITLSPLLAKDYTRKKEVRRFIERMVKYHRFNRNELYRLFKHVRFQREALSIYVPSLRPKLTMKKTPRRNVKKKLGSWDRYESYFLRKSKVIKGVAFMHRHRKWLKKAYRIYGVEPEYIAAIIGIESHFGANRGKFPVFDTLTTLAFEKHRRSKFYRKELEAFLLMTRREKVNPKRVMGSRAGAIGLGQFMPSNYEHFVVDFNGDGYHRMNTYPDAIGSIAHYFKRHGWQKGLPVAVRVSYKGTRFRRYKTGYRYRYHRRYLKGIKPRTYFPYKGKVHLIKLQRAQYDELWYGTKNFYVITRYNHSDYYAMAVHQLAQKLKKAYKRKYGKILR
jgi:membrane-bound lytic murein transglycosylase B